MTALLCILAYVTFVVFVSRFFAFAKRSDLRTARQLWRRYREQCADVHVTFARAERSRR